MSEIRISVIGFGYLGAVHATCMDRLGHDVVSLDVDAGKIATLRSGHTSFYEPGLDEPDGSPRRCLQASQR